MILIFVLLNLHKVAKIISCFILHSFGIFSLVSPIKDLTAWLVFNSCLCYLSYPFGIPTGFNKI